MKVLVLNCGSSSIKYQLFKMPEGDVLAKGIVQRIGEDFSGCTQKTQHSEIQLKTKIQNHDQALSVIEKMLTDDEKGVVGLMSEIGACGHRVVHGGEAVTGSVEVTDEVESIIEQYIDIAPLHNPANLMGIRAARKMMGDVPQIACFDTAFHQTLPQVAYLYALPFDLYDKFRIRRYGFHGTSHRYVARKAAELMAKGKYEVDLITCHLGNGCSMTAVKNGRSIDTSMGMTPLEGLVMGTRSGDMDASIAFYLVKKGYTVEQVDHIFNKKSGLLGISGISNDVRDLEEKAQSGNLRAQLALDIFAYRIKKYIGNYLAVLNGCDGIVFTGGIGENGVTMRKRILGELNNLGIIVDDEKNRMTIGVEGEIHAENSRIKIFIIPTNEEAAIAKDTYLMASGLNS